MIRTPKGGTVNLPDGGHAKTGNFPLALFLGATRRCLVR